MTSTPTDFQVLGIEPEALCILGICSSTELLNPEDIMFKIPKKKNEQIDIRSRSNIGCPETVKQETSKF